MYNGSTWMQTLSPDCRLNDLRIPGSHDSGTYSICSSSIAGLDMGGNSLRTSLDTLVPDSVKNATIVPWCRAQDKTVYDQLMCGVRYIDLRVAQHGGILKHTMVGTLRATPNYWITHGLQGCELKHILDDIIRFNYMYPKEVLIVDINHFYGFDLDASSMPVFRQYLENYPGLKTKLVGAAVTPSSTLRCVWEQISATNGSIIIILDDSPDKKKKKSIHCASPGSMLWNRNAIDSQWPNGANVEEVKEGILKFTRLKHESQLIVTQIQITPDASYVKGHIFGATGLRALAAISTGPVLTWLKSEVARVDPNIVIADYVNDDFCCAVVMLNTSYELPLVAQEVAKKASMKRQRMAFNSQHQAAVGKMGGTDYHTCVICQEDMNVDPDGTYSEDGLEDRERQELTNMTIVQAVPCGHMYHQMCLENIEHELCPQCRAVIGPNTRVYPRHGPDGQLIGDAVYPGSVLVHVQTVTNPFSENKFIGGVRELRLSHAQLNDPNNPLNNNQDHMVVVHHWVPDVQEVEDRVEEVPVWYPVYGDMDIENVAFYELIPAIEGYEDNLLVLARVHDDSNEGLEGLEFGERIEWMESFRHRRLEHIVRVMSMCFMHSPVRDSPGFRDLREFWYIDFNQPSEEMKTAMLQQMFKILKAARTSYQALKDFVGTMAYSAYLNGIPDQLDLVEYRIYEWNTGSDLLNFTLRQFLDEVISQAEGISFRRASMDELVPEGFLMDSNQFFESVFKFCGFDWAMRDWTFTDDANGRHINIISYTHSLIWIGISITEVDPQEFEDQGFSIVEVMRRRKLVQMIEIDD